MLKWSAEVKSGDADNRESRAAAYYGENLFFRLPGLEGAAASLPGGGIHAFGSAPASCSSERSASGSSMRSPM